MHRLPADTVINNRALLALPPATLQRMWPALELVEIVRGQRIGHIDRPIEHMYFVNRGLISLVKTMQDGRTVEIGAAGVEGLTDLMTLFGIDTAALEVVVQVPGNALRIRVDMVRALAAQDPPLHRMLQGYARFGFLQLIQTAACNRLHLLEERCCRWLLTAHDSALSDHFPLTHEFLAMMLGVQRSGVTVAANALKKAGLIEYTHGLVTITDRRGLERTACECYRTILQETQALYHRD